MLCPIKGDSNTIEIFVDMGDAVLRSDLPCRLLMKESPFLLALAWLTLLLSWRQNFGSVVFLVDGVFASPIFVPLDLWRVDLSVSSYDLTGDENIDGDIFKDDFQLKYFNLLQMIQSKE